MNAKQKLICLGWVFAVIFGREPAKADLASTNPPPRLTVELRDGSRVVGDSVEKDFKFHSGLLGDLKLAVADIRSVEAVSTNTAKLTAANGDVLMGAFADSKLAVKADFGKVDLSVGSIRKFTVAAGIKAGVHPAGLVAEWRGGDDTVTLRGGAAYGDGKVGRAFRFFGVNPCSRSGEGPDLVAENVSLGSGDFSIVLWANFEGVASGCARTGYPYDGVLVSKDEGGGGNEKWWFALDGNRLDFHMNGPAINGGSGVFLVQAFFRPMPKSWYHLAVTRKGDIFTIYVNGLAVGSQRDSHRMPAPNAPLTIGSAEGFYFKGLMDEIAIYDRALSADEIQSICVQENNGELPAPASLPQAAPPGGMYRGVFGE